MSKVRGVLLFSVGLELVALAGVSGAVAVPPEQPAAVTVAAAEPAAGAITVAGKPSECGCEGSCECAPLAGAWIATLSPKEKEYEDGITAVGEKGGQDGDTKGKKVKPLLQTFKFAPEDSKCGKFVVNAQTVARPQRVIKAFSEVTDLTEFVGIACQAKSEKVDLTAISFGVERTKEADKTIFIAVLSGTIDLPKEAEKDGSDKHECNKCKCCKDGCNDPKCTCKSDASSGKEGQPGKCSCCKNGCKYADCECKDGKDGKTTGKNDDQPKCHEPGKLFGELTVAYFDAEQDEDGDGFPEEGQEPIVVLTFKAKFKRVEVQPPCKPAKGHTPSDE